METSVENIMKRVFQTLSCGSVMPLLLSKYRNVTAILWNSYNCQGKRHSFRSVQVAFFVALPSRPDRFCDAHNLLFNIHLMLFPGIKRYRLEQCGANIKNAWRYIFTPP